MSSQVDIVNSTPQINQEQKQNDKEYNFAQIRKQLEIEREERKILEQRLEEAEKKRAAPIDDDDDSDEPYIDRKALKRAFQREIPRLKEEARNEILKETKNLAYPPFCASNVC